MVNRGILWILCPLCDRGLFRNGFAPDPGIPMQPLPVFYGLGTIPTALPEAIPSEPTANAPSSTKMVGIDALNAFQQELHITKESIQMVIPGLVTGDYPLMLRLEK